MKNFSYFRPESAEAAVALLEKTWGKVELLGGGTDLLDRQKDHVSEPEKVVALSGIKGFDQIVSKERLPPIITIGGGVKVAAVAADTGIRQHATALAEAAARVGTPQIRNMGT